jgi:glycosyltransferase involved in cell wall biosynthesis
MLALDKKLSVIIPCYNEAESLPAIVNAVMTAFKGEIGVEVLIVDDCSSDGSFAVAEKIAELNPAVVLLRHTKNKGKGAALKTGFLSATGDFMCVQDADLEYNPRDYLKMIIPLIEGRADVVFGSRYLQQHERRVLRWWHTAMNEFLTLFSNIMSDMALTDMETCYKLFKSDVIRDIVPRLKENRFGFEPECVAYVAKGMRTHGWKIVECAIAYRPRTFKEGKKIGWKDGVRALWCILKYNLFIR